MPPIVHEVLRSPGQPLDPATRAFMEPRFGHDFSQVRVHNDARAAESARAVNAQAYTVGRDVVFGTGRYALQTGDGRKLMAHEMAHVVQQKGDSFKKQIQRLVRPAYVSCFHPGRSGNGGLWHPRRTGDDVLDLITTADTRAITVCRNAENILSALRFLRVLIPGFPAPAILANALLTRFNIDAATVSDRQLELIQRRYNRVGNILEGGWIRYTCRGGECDADDWGYSFEGRYRIYLCNMFYSDTLNERGGTILHEAFHIYYPHIEDWENPALSNAHCYEQFARLLLGDAPATEPCI